uniref:Guanylate cyclase n=1 Tax=Gasterosteus aculeatus aculeatus TaxID=481459 RepID=A0AAQ4QA32_GASAC
MLPSRPPPTGARHSLLLLLLVQIAACTRSADNTTKALKEVTLAAILPLTNTDYAWAWPRVAPALFQAVRLVNSDPWLLPGLKLQLVHGSSENRDGFCSDSMAPLAAVDLKLSHDPWAFVGPGCDYSSSPVARFTTHWEVPMVTAGARAVGFEHFAAVTNTGPTHRKLGEFGVRIQEAMGWRQHAMLLFSDNKDANDDRPCYFAVEGLYTQLGQHNVSIRERVLQADNLDYKEEVQQIRDNGRVVYLCCSWDILRNLMVQFWKDGVELEDYIFFFIDLFAEGLGGRGPVRPWFRGDPYDFAARQAFRVTLYCCCYFHCYYWFIVKYCGLLILTILCNWFHDGVMMYSQALNETLNEQRTGSEPGAVRRPRGSVVTKRMWNRTFSGVMGPVEMDEFGDRQMDFAVWDTIDVESGEFQVVCVYNSSMKQLIMQGGRSFQWPGGSPPPDVPKCGFKNDKPACLAPIVVFALTNVLTSRECPPPPRTCLLNRKLKLESELAAQLWRVSWDDVQMSNLDLVLRRTCSRLTLSLKGSNCGSLMTMEGNFQIYTKTGYYKGNLAAIKYMNKKRIELTRKVLFELKHMRDVQNEHLTRFIGACIDPPNMCIITEYCPRGSLQILMESDSITLDWIIIRSVMCCCCQGMLFLHNSVMVSHGNLKSSNCVVDGRFVVKITDYGLESLRPSSFPEDTYAYYARKLWTAPELMRTDTAPPCGTQRGDVYSFSIILHEVALLRGVFYLDSLTMTPKGQCVHPRGPKTTGLIHGLCAFTLWRQKPWDSLGYGSNILDNPSVSYEQYANNLEELVEERTQAYHEEKRKAEALLYQILPHSVAEQLKRGETVQAEAFDSVTIYFSDIIGFTAMSAESTPLQVVTLLNDLYTCFDAIIDNFDVYKVETIGDAYMVVSGLPVRNGKLHGREVARMSLALLDTVKSFRVRHRANQQLRVRIGIHSGPVCAGVVGLKMPRYCLFGDTVNTASRMESNGEALRIHVSEATREVLKEFNCFQLEYRGEIEMKGKGSMKTFWLLGEEETGSHRGEEETK